MYTRFTIDVHRSGSHEGIYCLTQPEQDHFTGEPLLFLLASEVDSRQGKWLNVYSKTHDYLNSTELPQDNQLQWNLPKDHLS